MPNIKTKYLLLAIVAFGFILRVNNLTIGFPQLFLSNDEAIYHQSALNMIANKTPFTLGNYGPLGAYIQIPFLALASGILFITGKIGSVAELEFLLVTQEGYMLFIPRVISAMSGTLSILAVYALARDFFGSKTALWSAFVAAVAFNLVHISHLGRGWAPAIFFALVCVKFAISSVKEPKNQIKNTVISAVFAAFAFGFHQLSGIVLVLVLLVKFFGGEFGRKIYSRANVAGLSVFFALILLLNWLSLGPNFFGVLRPQNPTVGLVLPPPLDQGFAAIWKYYLEKGTFDDLPYSLIFSDGLIFALGIIFFIKSRVAKVYLPFSIFFVFNFLLLALLIPIFVRYFLISIAFFPIFAGWSINELVKKRSEWLVPVLIISISFNSLYWNFLISRKSTFDQLRAWLDANIQPETAIATANIRSIGYTPGNQAANVIRKTNPGYWRRASILIGDSYPPNVRNIIYADMLGAGSKSKNMEEAAKLYPLKYVIDTYSKSSERLLNMESGIKYVLVAHFSPTGEKIEENYLPQILTDAGFAVPLTKIDRAGLYFDVLEIDHSR